MVGAPVDCDPVLRNSNSVDMAAIGSVRHGNTTIPLEGRSRHDAPSGDQAEGPSLVERYFADDAAASVTHELPELWIPLDKLIGRIAPEQSSVLQGGDGGLDVGAACRAARHSLEGRVGDVMSRPGGG